MTPQQKQVTYEHDGLTFHATRDYGGDAWTARVELEATGPDAEGAVSALQERARKFGEVGEAGTHVGDPWKTCDAQLGQVGRLLKRCSHPATVTRGGAGYCAEHDPGVTP